MATTGFRRGELAGLRRDDIDLEHGRVTPSAPRVVVNGHAEESDTKTHSGQRGLALDPTTWDALRDYLITWDQERTLLGQDTPLLFVWPSGQPLHPDTITALFHKHCAAAGLPRIRLHDVRHSYATAALKAGVSPKINPECQPNRGQTRPSRTRGFVGQPRSSSGTPVALTHRRHTGHA